MTASPNAEKITSDIHRTIMLYGDLSILAGCITLRAKKQDNNWQKQCTPPNE